MTDGETHIVKRRNDVGQDHLILHRNVEDLREFLDEPDTAVAEARLGISPDGQKDWGIKAELFQRVNREIKELRDEGKIHRDFEEKENGFQSWVELMTFIDSESPGPRRLDAVKGMFYAVNQVKTTEEKRILAYQLFQIAKKLTSEQLFYLNLCYGMSKAPRDLDTVIEQQDVERKKAVRKLAHAVLAQLHRNNPVLVDLGLLTTRHLPEPFNEDEGELTALGVKFCEGIQKYHLEGRGHQAETHRCFPLTRRNPIER